MFQKSVLDPLMKRVDAVQGDAQALVQTSAPGVNTGGLESDLEIMVDKWSELNEKVQLVFLFGQNFTIKILFSKIQYEYIIIIQLV